MAIHIAFLTDSDKSLDPHTRAVEEALNTHASHAMEILGINWLVNITVNPDASLTIPETGDGGYTPNASWIQYSIDTSGNVHSLPEILERSLPGTIYHEMSHICRAKINGYGSTLLDALITEGLATTFEQEHWPELATPWGVYEESEVITMLEQVKSSGQIRANYYDSAKWFFGGSNTPRWLGYKVGTYIVRSAMKSGRDIRDLTVLPSDEILHMSGISV